MARKKTTKAAPEVVSDVEIAKDGKNPNEPSSAPIPTTAPSKDLDQATVDANADTAADVAAGEREPTALETAAQSNDGDVTPGDPIKATPAADVRVEGSVEDEAKPVKFTREFRLSDRDFYATKDELETYEQGVIREAQALGLRPVSAKTTKKSHDEDAHVWDVRIVAS